MIMNNILIAIPTLSSGGAERVASIWANKLAEDNERIFLFTLYPCEDEYYVVDKVNRINLCNSYKEYKKRSLFYKIRRINHILRENHIDVAITLVTYIGFLFYVAKKGLNTKIIETIRNNPSEIPKNKIMRMLRNYTVNRATGCIFQNYEQMEYFKPCKHSLIIQNPIEDDFLNCIRYYNSVPNKIIAVGRLHPQKNYKLLINAFKNVCNKYSNLYLEIYGEGILFNELNQYIETLNMQSKVFLKGRTNNILEKLLEADIYILSSDYEGMPNSLMEAMATGLPCISTDCPTGPSDIIINEENGILVPVDDVLKMEQAVLMMCDNYDLAKKMGIQAKKDMDKFNGIRINKKIKKFI